MHRLKSSGPFTLKAHHLAAVHRDMVAQVQEHGVALHVPPPRAAAVLAHAVASKPEGTFPRLMLLPSGAWGVGYGTFVLLPNPALLLAHHREHGVTLWASSTDVLRDWLHTMPAPAVPTPAPAPAALPPPAASVSEQLQPGHRYACSVAGPSRWRWSLLGPTLGDSSSNVFYDALRQLEYLAHVPAYVPWVVALRGSGGRELVGALAHRHGWAVLDTDAPAAHWPPLEPSTTRCVALRRTEHEPRAPAMITFVLRPSDDAMADAHHVLDVLSLSRTTSRMVKVPPGTGGALLFSALHAGVSLMEIRRDHASASSSYVS